jgi:hypothetical protein
VLRTGPRRVLTCSVFRGVRCPSRKGVRCPREKPKESGAPAWAAPDGNCIRDATSRPTGLGVSHLIKNQALGVPASYSPIKRPTRGFLTHVTSASESPRPTCAAHEARRLTRLAPPYLSRGTGKILISALGIPPSARPSRRVRQCCCRPHASGRLSPARGGVVAPSNGPEVRQLPEQRSIECSRQPDISNPVSQQRV